MITSIVSGISKVGEGFDQTNQNVPIEIPAEKLLEWLVTRKGLGRGWKGQLAGVQQQASRLREVEVPSYLSSLPDDPLRDLWQHIQQDPEPLDYFLIARVFNQLKNTAAEAGLDGKSFFGKYSDKRLQTWSELMSAYEKGNIYLGESAQTLGDLLNFDIPNLKKEIEKHKQQLVELQNKQNNHERNIQTYKTQLAQQCNDLKIPPSTSDFREALLSLTSELPALFEQVVAQSRSAPIKDAIHFHKTFIDFTRHTAKVNSNTSEYFPMLQYIINHGNETVQEMNTRLHPTSAPSAAVSSIDSPGQKEEELQIDWVTVSNSEEPEREITINWEDGTGEIIDGSTPAIVWDDVTNELDLDIEVVEAEATHEIEGISISATDEEPTVVENSNEVLLAHAQTRNQFLDNTFELEVFLSQRKEELVGDAKGKSNVVIDPIQLLLSQMNVDEGKEMKQSIEKHTIDNVQKQYAAVNELVTLFATGGRLRQLLEIKSSGRYVDRLVGGLQHQQDLIDKSQNGVVTVVASRQAVKEEQERAEKRMASLVSLARDKAALLMAALSKVYNREVTIVSPLL